MQFHLNGFKAGNPEISDAAERPNVSRLSQALPERVDVLIVGCGPAGLTLAAQLAAFPDIKTVIVEQKSGPLVPRPGRRRRLPHDGDVRGVRFQRARTERGLLGQRNVFLEARRQRAGEARPQRQDPGCRRRLVRVPACDPEPGARARFLSRCDAQRSNAARAALFAPIAWILRSLLHPARRTRKAPRRPTR